MVVVAAFATPAPAGADSRPRLVPSLTPAATQRLWTQLVRRRREGREPSVSRGCRPLRAVFYAQNDWLRLATTLAANASPCAQYYISIPPLAADKTQLRTDQAWRIRALGSSFHAVAEIQYAGWSKWVSANASTWYDAGVEARRRMAAAGFDVAAGDTWAVNEFSSGVRRNDPGARQAVRDFVRGLYTGDGSTPAVKGVVFDIGMDEATPDLSAYKSALAGWYLDGGFWQDMSAYVSDWSQELYGDVRDEAVGGAPTSARIEHLNDYFGHQLALANAGPPDVAAARGFLQQTYSPLANAAWAWSSAYGYTNVPVDQMEDYVSAEVAALRTLDASAGLAGDHFGFAWAPRMPNGGAWTSQFTSDSGALVQRLAVAIHDSDQSPEAACAPSWCTAALSGAAFVETWKTFATWTQQLAFASPPATLAAGTPSGPLQIQLQANGKPLAAASSVQVTLSSSSSGATFATGPAGPWTTTLAVTIPAGNTGATFYYTDPNAGTPTITATAPGVVGATQVETVSAAPAASPDLRVALAADVRNAPPPGGSLVYHVTVTTANGVASSSASVQVTLPTGYALTSATADRGSGCTPGAGTVTCELGAIDPGADAHVTISGAVGSTAEQVATAVVTSASPPEANPADNTATLRLRPVPPHAVTRPRLLGAAKVGRRLRVLPPAWSRTPASVRYQWEVCGTQRCVSIGGATAPGLRLRPPFAGKRVRVRATGVFEGRRVESTSAPVLVRR